MKYFGILLITALHLSAVAAGTADTTTDTPVSEQIIAELQQADRARSQRMSEAQEWEMEEQRLELLLSTLQREAERLEKEASRDEGEYSLKEKEASALIEKESKLQEWRIQLDELAEVINSELDELNRISPPGLVPKQIPPTSAKPEEHFYTALRRLDQTTRMTESAGIELVSGTLNGESVTVRLLRAGGVTAWWQSLDGENGGTATSTSGNLTLQTGTAGEIEQIHQSFEIMESRSPAKWVFLPMQSPEAP